MATKTFEELKQLAIQIRDEKTNKQNTATRVGTAMLEHINKLEQDYYDKTKTDEELKKRDDKLTEIYNKLDIKVGIKSVAKSSETAIWGFENVLTSNMGLVYVRLILDEGISLVNKATVYDGSTNKQIYLSTDWQDIDVTGYTNFKVFLQTNIETDVILEAIDTNGVLASKVIENTQSIGEIIKKNETLTNDIEILQTGVGSKSEAIAEEIWENGGINSETGADNNAAADTRRRTSFVPINYSKVIPDISANNALMIMFYKTDKTFISTYPGTYDTLSVKENVPIDIDTIKPEDAEYYRIMLFYPNIDTDNLVIYSNATGLHKEIEYLKEKLSRVYNLSNLLIVDEKGNGDYTTIEDALNNANDTDENHVIILVMPGTYYPAPAQGLNAQPYAESNRNISIIGVDKNFCILKGDVGYYYYQIGVDYSLLRLNGNVTIANLTLDNRSDLYEQTATENGWDLTSPHCRAYCVHVDKDRQENSIVEIRNCKMYNDHFTCVGFGTRPNSTLRIIDCETISDVSEEKDKFSTFSSYGTIYGHLSANSTEQNQNLEIVKCKIVNTNYETAVNLMDAAGEGAEGSVKLLQNVCFTTNNENSFKKVGKFVLDKTSFGNNISLMNEDSFSSSVFFGVNNKLNNLFKEIYLSGNGFDKTHNYYIYSILRNFEGIGWAISIKDANTQESTGWIVFSSEEEIKGYVKVVKGGYTVEAILSDWNLFVDSQTNFEQNDSILSGNQFDISFSPAIKGIHENNDLSNKYDKISESVLQNRNVICKSSNLFDFGESGKFINQEGNIATGEEYYKISSYQKVSEGDILLFTGKYQTTSYFNALYGYEDENRKNPIVLLDWSGDAEYVNKEVVIPAGINYIQGWNDTRKNANPILRFKTEQDSINTDLYDKIQSIEKNTGSHIAIYVNKNGDGDFTSFVDAIKSIKDSSNDKIYDVYINEGEYDIVSEYFGEQDYTDSTDKGLNIPDYVNLIGLGDRDKIVLKGEMPDTIKYSTSQYYSTINIQYNNNLENLTVTAYNCRYPIHDQTSAKSKDCVRKVKNCIFIHKGYNGTPYTGSVDAEHNTTQYRWGSAHAYGQGTNSGSYCSFDYCHFDAQGNTGSAFLTHDDSAAVKGTEIIITNCQFNNKGTSNLIQISALGAKNCIITFVGNKFEGNKTIKCANSSINQSQKFNYYLYGYGNSECVISVPEGEEGKDNIIQ